MVGFLSTKNSDVDISQPEEIRVPQNYQISQIYVYIIGLLHLASKRVISGSDCLKIDGGCRGLRPRPNWGSLQCSIRTLAVLRGPTSKGWEGKDARRKGRGKWGKGEGRGRGRLGVCTVGLKPSQSKISGYVTVYKLHRFSTEAHFTWQLPVHVDHFRQ